MIGSPSIQAATRDLINNDVWSFVGSGTPTDGTSGTGVNIGGPGSTYYDSATGNVFLNIGTKASPVWDLVKGSVLTTLTSAQVKALRATPITLVAAPPAGYYRKFVGAILALDYGGSNVFTEGAVNLAVRLTGAAGVIVSQTIENTGFIDQAGDTMTTAEPKIDAIAAKAACDAQLLCLHNTGGAEIAGNAANDNIVRVRTWYRTLALGW